jgi:hypothetical protein
MDKTTVINRLRAREASLLEDLAEVRVLLKAMERKAPPGRDREAMRKMAEARWKKPEEPGS